MQNRTAIICKQQHWSIMTSCTLGDLETRQQYVQTVLVCMCTTSNFFQAIFIPQLAKATETKHSCHNYAVSKLAQARPHNTLYLD